MITSLNKLDDGSSEITITIPWKRIQIAYEKEIVKTVQSAEIKGFRKGKAPRNLVEDKLDKTKVYEEILKTLIPEVYVEALKEHSLKPIVSPQVSVISLEENKDWQIKAVTAELPEVILGDYQAEIKKESAAAKIWVPGKDKTAPAPASEDHNHDHNHKEEDEKINKIFQILLKTAKVKLPKILTEDEVTRMLSRLIDQTGRLGVTVEQYLSSIGKTSDQLRTEYTQQAAETLSLELILSKIADITKVEIDDKEIEQMIAAVPENQRAQMQSPEQKAYIKQLLRKRKVLENLAKL